MFFVELKVANNKNIYDTNSLLQCKIKFEQLHIRYEMPQKCQNTFKCQRYRHTKNCFRQERCVKCARDHVAGQTPKDQDRMILNVFYIMIIILQIRRNVKYIRKYKGTYSQH
jgi:hypothetical protein